jgi:lysophospholipase L1-like esterase
MAMEWYEPEVRELERKAVSVQCPVVFYGSSSIRLWPRLESRRIVNRGFGGSTLEACAYFFERLVVPLHPRSLVVYAGENDLGDGRSPEQVLGWFRELAAKIDRHLPGIPFGYISVKPSPARTSILERIRLANSLVKQEIDRHPAAYFIQVLDSMLDSEGRPRQELYLPDGLHLSLAGYRLWDQLLVPFGNRIFTPPSEDCNNPPLSLTNGESRVQKVVQPSPES